MAISIIAIAVPTPSSVILPASVPFLAVLVPMSVLASVARMIIVVAVVPR